MAVLVTRAETVAYHLIQIVCLLVSLIATRPRPSRFETNSRLDVALVNEVTEAVAKATNEAIKANALVKIVRIISLASYQKKNSIASRITSVLTVAVLVTRAETVAYYLI